MKNLMNVLFCLALLFYQLFADDPKIKIAILTLKNSNGVSQGEIELLSDRLRNEFFSTGKVDVMERDQMREILKEQGLQQAGLCTDEGCIVEIGKILGVQRLVTGSIGKLGTLFMINVRSIDVTTGKLTASVSEDVKGDIEDVVTVLNYIATRICGVVPKPEENNLPEKQKGQSEPVPAQSDSSVKKALPCDNRYFMESITFEKSTLGFQLESKYREEIEENLADALEEALDNDIYIESPGLISGSTCPAKVLRIKLLSYKTEKSGKDQLEATVTLAISLFNTPLAVSPLVTVKIEKTGDRHWGDVQPLLNAIDEIVDLIEEDFESKVEKYLK